MRVRTQQWQLTIRGLPNPLIRSWMWALGLGRRFARLNRSQLTMVLVMRCIIGDLVRMRTTEQAIQITTSSR